VTLENLFQVQWKNDTFHLHEFCRQPFHYNPLVYIEGYSELAASPNMHVPHTWKVTERLAIFYFCQNVVETLHGISEIVTDLSGQCVGPTMRGQAAQECWKSW